MYSVIFNKNNSKFSICNTLSVLPFQKLTICSVCLMCYLYNLTTPILNISFSFISVPGIPFMRLHLLPFIENVGGRGRLNHRKPFSFSVVNDNTAKELLMCREVFSVMRNRGCFVTRTAFCGSGCLVCLKEVLKVDVTMV